MTAYLFFIARYKILKKYNKKKRTRKKKNSKKISRYKNVLNIYVKLTGYNYHKTYRKKSTFNNRIIRRIIRRLITD